MPVYRDGEPAEPIGPQGILAKMEFWFRGQGFVKVANALACLDEKGLGK